MAENQMTVEEAIKLCPVVEIPTGLAITMRDLFMNVAALDQITVRTASEIANAFNQHVVSAIEAAQKNSGPVEVE